VEVSYMPLPTETKLLELTDVKISPLTSDADPPVYGTSVDVPGIQTLEVTPKLVSKELRGDDKVLDVYSRVETIEWKWSCAKLPLDVLDILLGGAVTASGTTPNQKQIYSLTGADRPGWFKLEGQVAYVDDGLGDVHVVLYKCKCTGGAAFGLGDDFAKLEASGVAIPLSATDQLFDVVLNETATDIS
jgi:hypothetical protein